MNFGQEEQIKVFRTTVKKVVANLSLLKDIHHNDFIEEVETGFAGYDYEGEDEVIGHDVWPDISKDGTYEVCTKVNHDHAYEFTLHILVKDQKVTVTNVL